MKLTKRISYIILLFSVFLFSCSNKKKIDPSQKDLSGSYLSGDVFKGFCHFIYEENHKENKFSNMKKGDLIFVNGYLLEEFFQKIHPTIPKPYVLISHNSDMAIPHRNFTYLNDPKLIAWFGQNVHIKHPKIIPIPIGLANRQYKHGNMKILEKVKHQNCEKKHLVYLNFVIENYPRKRAKVYESFSDKKYCFIAKDKPYEEYLKDTAESKFVICPRGNGLDCHRTWEVLYLDSIPIVESSPLDPLLENLPILIVKDWNEVTEERLNSFYENIKTKKFQTEKLYAKYWYDLIEEKRKSL